VIAAPLAAMNFQKMLCCFCSSKPSLNGGEHVVVKMESALGEKSMFADTSMFARLEPFETPPAVVEKVPTAPSRNGMFTVILEKPCMAPWAIDLNYRRPRCLYVVKVKDGPISNYNRETPDKMIQAGDWIEQVNEVRNDSQAMLQEVISNSTMKLVVRKAWYTGDSHMPGVCGETDESTETLTAHKHTSADVDANAACHSERIHHFMIFPECAELAEGLTNTTRSPSTDMVLAAQPCHFDTGRLRQAASPKRRGAFSRPALAQIAEESRSTSVGEEEECSLILPSSPSGLRVSETARPSPESNLTSGDPTVALQESSCDTPSTNAPHENNAKSDAAVVNKDFSAEAHLATHLISGHRTSEPRLALEGEAQGEISQEVEPLPPGATAASKTTQHEAEGRLQEQTPVLLGRTIMAVPDSKVFCELLKEELKQRFPDCMHVVKHLEEQHTSTELTLALVNLRKDLEASEEWF